MTRNLTGSIDGKVNSTNTTKKSGRLATYALAAFLAGCAGIQRGCSSCVAENFATDWIVA